VLRPGGRIAFTVWALPQKAIGFGMLLKAIEKHGRMDVPLPEGPPMFRFSDPQESQRALTQAGFVMPRVQEVQQTLRIRAPETPFDMMMRGGVRVAAVLRAQTPGALEAIKQDVLDSAAAFVRDGVMVVPMPCVLVSARKA
jgi:hypothetical protein